MTILRLIPIMGFKGERIMSKAEMRNTVEMSFDKTQLITFGIMGFIFISGSLTMMIVGFLNPKLDPIGWGGLALFLWMNLLTDPFFVFFGHRYFHYLRKAEDYIPVKAFFAPGGSFGSRSGSYFSAQFDWEGKRMAIDTHCIFSANGINLFDLPLIADYANKENQIAYNPKDGTIVVVGLV